MILDEIIAHKQREIARLKSRFTPNPFDGLTPLPGKGRLKQALQGPGINVIAEVKKASPSRGILKGNLDVKKLAAAYERGGAAAVSVLTDQRFFQGSMEDLADVKHTVAIPVLRKDFILDPCQIYQARLGGADAVLLIAAVLEERRLKELIDLAGQCGLDALVEVHSREELIRALDCEGEIIGINNRDLTTFQVNLAVTLDLAPLVPDSCLAVSESGIHTRADVELLRRAGVKAFLVGEALVTAPDAAGKIRELLGDEKIDLA